MKLDRNDPDLLPSGRGKYALLKLRKLDDCRHGTFGELSKGIQNALKTLENAGILDWGVVDTPSEFFVMRLKDRYAQEGLRAYATAARIEGDIEWADEVDRLANKAGPSNPNCKKPD